MFQWSKAKVALTVLPVCWMTLAITPSLANMEGMWFRDTISSGMCFMTSANALAWSHHAASCRHGGDVIAQHNHLRDIFADFCCHAYLPVKAEVGYGLGRDNVNSRPADVYVQGLDRGNPTSLLHHHSLLSPSVKLVWHLGQQHL